MTPIEQKFTGAITAEYFGVVASVRVLPGEPDKNLMLTTDAGEGFILKFSHPQTVDSQIDFEIALLTRLPGRMLVDVRPRSKALFVEIGGLGVLNRTRADFEHPAIGGCSSPFACC